MMTLRGNPRLEGHSFGVKGKALAVLLMLTVIATLAYDPDWFREKPGELEPFNPDNLETLTSAFKDLQALELDSAKAKLQPLVEAGDPDGLYLLGYVLCIGDMANENAKCRDDAEAWTVISAAAEAGHAGAQLDMAMRLKGRARASFGVLEEWRNSKETEVQEVLRLLSLSAAQGHRMAELLLVMNRIEAETIDNNDLKSLRLLGENGSLMAHYLLGKMFAQGAPNLTGSFSLKRGWKDLRIAAEQGFIALGPYVEWLVKGKGVKTTKEQALRWLALAQHLDVKVGEATAQSRLLENFTNAEIKASHAWAKAYLQERVADKTTQFGKAANWCEINLPGDGECLVSAAIHDSICYYHPYSYMPMEGFRESPLYDFCRTLLREVELSG